MREVTTLPSIPVFLGRRRKKKRKKKERIMDRVDLAVELVNEFDLSAVKVVDALLEGDSEKIADKLVDGVDEDKKDELKKNILDKLG